MVNAWFMQPFVMCRKFMNAFFSSLSIENTSRLFSDELTTSLRLRKFSMSVYFSLIFCAASKSIFSAFDRISETSFSCSMRMSPFRIVVTSSIYFEYSACEILPMQGAQHFSIWYSRQQLNLPALTASGVIFRLQLRKGYSSFINSKRACSAPAFVYGPK